VLGLGLGWFCLLLLCAHRIARGLLMPALLSFQSAEASVTQALPHPHPHPHPHSSPSSIVLCNLTHQNRRTAGQAGGDSHCAVQHVLLLPAGCLVQHALWRGSWHGSKRLPGVQPGAGCGRAPQLCAGRLPGGGCTGDGAGAGSCAAPDPVWVWDCC